MSVPFLRNALLAGACAAAIGVASPAFASYVAVDFSFGPLSEDLSYTNSANDLYQATSVSGLPGSDLNVSTASGASGVLTAGDSSVSLSGLPGPFTSGTQSADVSETFASSYGDYTAVFDSLLSVADKNSPDALTWYLSGTLTTPDSSPGDGGTEPIYLTVSLSNSGPDTSTSVTYNESSQAPAPLNNVPEPTTLAVISMGLIGLGTARMSKRRGR